MQRFGPLVTALLLLAVVGMPAYAETEAAFAEVEQRMAEEVVAFINAERVAAGLNPLEVWHTNEFAVRSNEDYRDTGEAHRIIAEVRAEGYPASIIGEIQGVNVYAEGMVDGWMNSPGHHDIMMGPAAVAVAVAVGCFDARGGAFFTGHILQGVSTGQADAPVAGGDDRGLTSCSEIVLPRDSGMEQVAAYLPWVGGGLAALLVLSLVSTVADRRKQRTMEQQAAAQVANERQTRPGSNRGMAQVIDDLTP